VRLGALVGGVLVVIRELGVQRRSSRIELRAGGRDLLGTGLQAAFHLLFVELCQPNPVL
jgi:hypothetical protein